MRKIFNNLYEDTNTGYIYKQIQTASEVIEYCEKNKTQSTERDIKNLYYRLGLYGYLSADYIEKKETRRKQNITKTL